MYSMVLKRKHKKQIPQENTSARMYTHTCVRTLRRSIILPGRANNEYVRGPSGPGSGFCGRAGGFISVAVVACHYFDYY